MTPRSDPADIRIESGLIWKFGFGSRITLVEVRRIGGGLRSLSLVVIGIHIEVLEKNFYKVDLESSADMNVIKTIIIPQKGGHFERRVAIGRRNTPLNSHIAVSRTQKTSSCLRK